MTSRKCPWCGGQNLRVTNVMGDTQTISWEDRDCGYREKTGYGPDYEFKSCVEPKQRKKDYVKRVCEKKELGKEEM
jgi:hypothetical protein